MRAVILAAGRGSRMAGLTDTLPKCLLELGGKSLLDWQIEALQEGGASEIGIVTGYRRKLLRRSGLKEFHNDRWHQTNMVSSLERAGSWLEESPCLVSYSDIFYEGEAIRTLVRTTADIAIVYSVHWRRLWERRFANPLDDAETFRVDSAGALLEIGNKPRRLDDVQGQYMGLLRFTPAGWSEIVRIRSTLSAEERDRMHMTGTLQRVIEAGRHRIRALPYGGDWGEVDAPGDLALYRFE